MRMGMKKMSFALTVFAALGLALSMSACDDKDDDTPVTPPASTYVVPSASASVVPSTSVSVEPVPPSKVVSPSASPSVSVSVSTSASAVPPPAGSDECDPEAGKTDPDCRPVH